MEPYTPRNGGRHDWALVFTFVHFHFGSTGPRMFVECWAKEELERPPNFQCAVFRLVSQLCRVLFSFTSSFNSRASPIGLLAQPRRVCPFSSKKLCATSVVSGRPLSAFYRTCRLGLTWRGCARLAAWLFYVVEEKQAGIAGVNCAIFARVVCFRSPQVSLPWATAFIPRAADVAGDRPWRGSSDPGNKGKDALRRRRSSRPAFPVSDA